MFFQCKHIQEMLSPVGMPSASEPGAFKLSLEPFPSRPYSSSQKKTNQQLIKHRSRSNNKMVLRSHEKNSVITFCNFFFKFFS